MSADNAPPAPIIVILKEFTSTSEARLTDAVPFVAPLAVITTFSHA